MRYENKNAKKIKNLNVRIAKLQATLDEAIKTRNRGNVVDIPATKRLIEDLKNDLVQLGVEKTKIFLEDSNKQFVEQWKSALKNPPDERGACAGNK